MLLIQTIVDIVRINVSVTKINTPHKFELIGVFILYYIR